MSLENVKGTVLVKTFSLPLVVCGEQDNALKAEAIPFDKFVLNDDKDFAEQLKADDREDKYIYAYTDSGVSKNNLNWKPENMVSMSEQVVSKMPVGYLGHIKPSDYGFDFPEPQLVWFGSFTEELPNATRLWLKGYVLPTAEKLKIWVKTKAVDSISVYGKISYKMNGEVVDVQDVDLKSIDISRKLGEGLNSKIAGLYGEMEATYDDLKKSLEDKVRSYIRDNYATFGFKKNPDSNDVPYVYAWIRKLYIEKDIAIISIEVTNEYSLFEVGFVLTKDDKDESSTFTEYDVDITYIKEVVEHTSYVNKKDGLEFPKKVFANVGEINKQEEDNKMPDTTPITFEAVMADKYLYEKIRTHVATEMATESEQKTLILQASEMRQISDLFGEQEGLDVVNAVKNMTKFSQKLVSEMSAIFGETSLEPETIVEKTKEAVETVNAVKETLAAKDSKDVLEKLNDVVEENKAATAKEAISEVDDAFAAKIDELDESLAEFVRDDFEKIIGVKPEDIDGDVEAWKANALKDIEDNFDKVVEKYEARLQKIHSKGRAVGEMNVLGDLGGNINNGKNQSQQLDDDPDVAEAKRLGYGG